MKILDVNGLTDTKCFLVADVCVLCDTGYHNLCHEGERGTCCCPLEEKV